MMKNSRSKVISEIKYLLKTPNYFWPVLVTAFFTYYFFCSHISIGIDDLASARYTSGELLAQGRYTGQLIDFFFPFDKIECLYNLIGILFYTFSTVAISALFRTIIKNDTKILKYTLFSCIFISYSLVVEIFVYHGLAFAIGGNTILIIVIIIMVLEKINYWFIWSTLLMSLSIAWHEGEIPVYVFLVFMILFLYRINNISLKFRTIIYKGIEFAYPLVVGIILKVGITKLLFGFYGIKRSEISGNNILYKRYGISECISKIIEDIKFEYILKAGYYLPIFILMIAVCICLITFIFICIKEKTPIYLFFYMGFGGALISLTVISGELMPFRASQVFTIFVASAFWIIGYIIELYFNKNYLSKFYCIICIVLILNQIIDMNYWFEIDYQRSENEKALIQELGYDLVTNYDIDKPIVFTGYCSLSDNLKDKLYIDSDSKWASFLFNIGILTNKPTDQKYWIAINQNYGQSIISWGIFAFGEVNTELIRAFSFYGFDLKQGNEEMYIDAINELPIKKNKINIIDKEKYIHVHFY